MSSPAVNPSPAPLPPPVTVPLLRAPATHTQASPQAPTGAVTAARGFRAASTYCGIRKAQKPDLALVVSDRPAAAAAVFTRNLAQAAPILVCRAHLAVAE